MPIPDALDPLDPNPGVTRLSDDGAGPVRDDTADLAAVPTFLRERVRAAISRPESKVWARGPMPPDRAKDVAALPMAGIAPRRLVVIGAALILAWLLVSFGRQVAEASAASSRAGELRAANAALTTEVAAMERELKLIQEGRFVAQAARGYRLGTSREIPFALQANAPPLAPDAPGSASVRLGAGAASGSPIETWLDVLFGPGG